ncbi:MAG: hypothetical protein HZA22_03440 [Nitrospirae bacterium]|nr:hypothetical protein [Nitrospirota bacterium]MBI5695799.1 hypothetical protein [Nitrospirota bacterium]
MKQNPEIEKPGFVYRYGKLVSVILDIREYEELLLRLDDIEELKYIEELKNKGPMFQSIEEV